VQLSRLLHDIDAARVTGDPDLSIRGLAYDSRAVEPGFLFAALRGGRRDGLEHAAQAAAAGATAIMASRPPLATAAGVTWGRCPTTVWRWP
jgi:UDP-N-acetylmuramyl pentapeptide synthase